MVYRQLYENLHYDPAINGEAWLLGRLGLMNPTQIFDVGANVGDWAAIALEASKRCPNCAIHCFEIVPGTADVLAQRFAGQGRVVVNKLGLLDAECEVPVKYYVDFPPNSSVNDFPHSGRYTWLRARATTGATYCEERGIKTIDLLKIDAEGADHRVLRGFENMLAEGAIQAVQFEYGLSAIQTRFLLADYFEFLGQRGYAVGKLFPNHVEFRPYDITRDEDFLGPNYVAVRRDRQDLLGLLQG